MWGSHKAGGGSKRGKRKKGKPSFISIRKLGKSPTESKKEKGVRKKSRMKQQKPTKGWSQEEGRKRPTNGVALRKGEKQNIWGKKSKGLKKLCVGILRGGTARGVFAGKKLNRKLEGARGRE